ncbi:hypothetical protein V8E54_006276, partial [Elaphomyces granulatus]
WRPIHVAHLYPYSMRSGLPSTDSMNIWKIIRIFWTSSRVQSWEYTIFSNGTEIVENLVCLAPHFHTYQAFCRYDWTGQ